MSESKVSPGLHILQHNSRFSNTEVQMTHSGDSSSLPEESLEPVTDRRVKLHLSKHKNNCCRRPLWAFVNYPVNRLLRGTFYWLVLWSLCPESSDNNLDQQLQTADPGVVEDLERFFFFFFLDLWFWLLPTNSTNHLHFSLGCRVQWLCPQKSWDIWLQL